MYEKNFEDEILGKVMVNHEKKVNEKQKLIETLTTGTGMVESGQFKTEEFASLNRKIDSVLQDLSRRKS